MSRLSRAGRSARLLHHISAWLPQHQLPVRPERRGTLAEQRVVERPQREMPRPAALCSRGAASAASTSRRYTRRRWDRTSRARLRGARSPSSRNASSRKNRTPCSTDRSSVCSRMSDDESHEANERFCSWPRRSVVRSSEPRFDHHLLAVVRPPLDKRRRREEERLAHLRFHLAQVLVLEEVSRDRPRASRSTRASGS